MPNAQKTAQALLQNGGPGGKKLSIKQAKMAQLVAKGKMPTRIQDMPKAVRKKVMNS